MKTYQMAKYADDTGRLADPDDAAFLARKLASDDRFDFAGVSDVVPAFLDALFVGLTPTTLEGRVTGLGDALTVALEAWATRLTATDSGVPPTVPPIAPPPPTPDPCGEHFTPTRLVNRLRQQLRSYIESAYPLSDPVLVRSRRRLLDEAAGGHLLGQEPYVETTPRYRSHPGGYDTLGLPPHTAALFAQLAVTPRQYAPADDPKPILYSTMWMHQATAYREFLVGGKDLVVATGTGSGKTECFLVPMLGTLFDEAVTRPDDFRVPGVRVLILYPMNALVNDQVARLRLLFGDETVASTFRDLGPGRRHPRFGMYTGRTPYPGHKDVTKDRLRVAPLLEHYLNLNEGLRAELRRLGRYPAKDLDTFYAEDRAGVRTVKSGKAKGQERNVFNFDERLHTPPLDRELLTRQEMVKGAGADPGDAPDILVTNYSMLEYMLMRPFERPLFDQSRDWLRLPGSRFLLVLDEAHMYRGAKGAEIAFLLRRLRARLGITDRPDKLRVICTSTSLGTKREAIEQVRRFAADLTGKTPEDFRTVTGSREVPEPAEPDKSGFAAALAAVDLDALHTATTADGLRAAVRSVDDFLRCPCEAATEDGVLRHLHECLSGQPVVNLLMKGLVPIHPERFSQYFP